MFFALAPLAGRAHAAEPVEAQPPPPPPPAAAPPPVDTSLEARVAALEAELRARDEADIQRDAEALAAANAPPPSTGGAPALYPLNAGLTAFGDVLGQLGVDDDGPMPGSTMYLRSLELDVRAAVDPFAKAVAVIAFEQEAPPLDGSAAAGEFEVVPEETYVELVALPWRFSGKVGKFKQPFGLMNRTHPHDLPWVDVPAALELLAEEGYNDTGATLSWLVPAGPFGITLTGGGLSGDPFEEGVPDAALAGLGRVEAFGGFGSVDVGVGASAVRHFGVEEQALGADFSFRYRRSTRQSVVLLAEVIRSMDGVLGGYAALQVQPRRSVYLGFREDFLDGDPQHNLFVSYYTSEFLRVRVGGGYAPASQTADALAQLTFVWGSHPIEPWWVNK
jgi:hypothetical protein